VRRFLLAIAIAGGLTACRHETTTGSIRLDPDLASLVPADTLFIMAADVDSIRNTSVYQKHIGIVDLPRLNEFTQKTGVDPRKDLSEVLSTSNGKAGVFMARGQFHTSDLEARLEKEGAARFEYKGRKLFGDDKNAVTFLDSPAALAGSTSVLKSIVDERNRARHGLPTALADRVRTIHAGSQIWVAFIGGVQGLKVTAPEGSNLAAAIGLLQGIDNAALGMDLRNGFDLNGDAVCKSEENAKQLRLALKAVIGLGRLSTPDSQPDLLKMYDAIQVDQAQTKVIVTAHVPPELVDRFVDLWVKKR
jgi:hypothetical protein